MRFFALSARRASFTLALLTVTLVSCHELVTAPTGPDDRLVYTFRSGGSSPHVWLMSEDGHSRRQLDSLWGSSYDPIWSPDGERVAFIQLDGETASGSTTIIVMNRDGSVAARISSGNRFQFQRPSWAPDGRRLVFSSYSVDRNDVRIATIRVDGGGYTELTGPIPFGGSGVMSPDGATVVFVCGNVGLCSVPSSGGNARTIAPSGWSPRFSPDGTSIAFVASDGLRVANADGSGSRVVLAGVAPSGGGAFVPGAIGWSPDGTQLVFAGHTPSFGSGDISVVAVSGGMPHQLTSFGADVAFSPDWSNRP
jgi:Tol biopolymer transport system component